MNVHEQKKVFMNKKLGIEIVFMNIPERTIFSCTFMTKIMNVHQRMCTNQDKFP